MIGPANLLDRVIAYVAPERAAQRVRSRIAAGRLRRLENELRLRRFEAAASGRRTAGWKASNASVNAETERDLDRLRARARDLVQNNGWASKAVRVWVSNGVASGIYPRAVPTSEPGERPSAAERRRAAEIDRVWKDWANGTDCDAAGRTNFAGLQRLVAHEVVEAGEVLVRRRFRRAADRLAVPIQLQVLEADHLDTLHDGILPNGGRVVQGVEFNSIGRPVAYWLFPDHPGDSGMSTFRRFESRRVPASEVAHVFRTDRAGQARGIPWGSPAMLTLRDFDDYADAELVRVKIASAYVGFVRDMEPPEVPPGDDQTEEDAIAFEPGTWEYLPPGKDITFSDPPETTGFKDYASATLHQVAAGYGVPYEALTGDLSGLSFSGGRLGRLDFRADVEAWQTTELIPQFCDRAWRWFLEAGQAFGAISDQLSAQWTCPPARMIEPSREVAAIVAQVRGGLMSLSEAIRRMGGDPRRVFEELAHDREEVLNLGLDLSSIVTSQTSPEVPDLPAPQNGRAPRDRRSPVDA